LTWNGEEVIFDVVADKPTGNAKDPFRASMSSIKRDVKKKLLPRPEGE
jgi:hypothetical protein